MKNILLTSLIALAALPSVADDHSAAATKGLYAGGGISYNNLDFGSVVKGADNESAAGFQLFAGVPIANTIENIDTFVEVGYFQTGTFDFGPGNKEKVNGISGSVVLHRNLSEIDPNLYGLARIGLEIGDDDGAFMGVGAGYRVTPKVEVRAEFVNKDLISSYQANALIRF